MPEISDMEVKMKRKLYFEEYIISALILIMLVVLGANVIGRYFLNAALAFTEELVVYLFLVVSLLGAPAACARGANMGLSIIVERLPKNAQKAFIVISTIASIALFVLLFMQGVDEVLLNIKYGTRTPILLIPNWLFTISFPIGSALYIYRVVTYSIKQIKEM